MDLLAGVHACGEGHAGDLLLDRTFDRGHGHVADAAVVEALLQVVPLTEVRRHLTVQIDLYAHGQQFEYCWRQTAKRAAEATKIPKRQELTL